MGDSRQKFVYFKIFITLDAIVLERKEAVK